MFSVECTAYVPTGTGETGRSQPGTVREACFLYQGGCIGIGWAAALRSSLSRQYDWKIPALFIARARTEHRYKGQ